MRRLSDTHEVDALVKLIDRLPRLVNAMDDDVMPLLDRLDQSGPDLSHLLDSVSDLNRMAGRLPTVFRRRPADVPEETVNALKARTAELGLTLASYLRGESARISPAGLRGGQRAARASARLEPL